MSKRAKTLRPSGGYRELRSFQCATVVYDATVSFCERWIDKRSRTYDQMVQGARSGRQNIAEGSCAAATSTESELRLTNVARASLEELLLDYGDFLRQRGMPQWEKESPEALEVRAVGTRETDDRSDAANWNAYAPWLTHTDPAIVANALICLIHQTKFLLDRQIESKEQQFIKEGGYRENLTAARLEERRKQDRSKDPVPACPTCNGPMTLRTARKGKNAGSQFWGCCAYPKCKGSRPYE